MNIHRINLNLLIALDALLTERHVSRAAQKIFITQPAMSNSLLQLRELFNDELLVRSGKNMLPTPLALEILPKIKQIMQQIEETFTTRRNFDPATSERKFRIAMSDYMEFILLPLISEKLIKYAPNISLKIIHANMLDNANIFVDRNIDLGIGVVTFPTSSFINAEVLFKEEAICAASAGHPAMKKLTLKAYKNAKHLAIAYQDDPVLALTDAALKEIGSMRNISLAIPHMLSAMHVLAKTPLLATVPKRMALSLQKQLNLVVQKLPFSVPSVTISQIWHNRFDNDAGHQWLRTLIKEIGQKF